MTPNVKAINEFREAHGKEWGQFVHSAMYRDLLTLLDKCSPLRNSPNRTPGDAVAGGHVLFAEIQGYELASKLIRDDISNVEISEELGDPKYRPEKS